MLRMGQCKNFNTSSVCERDCNAETYACYFSPVKIILGQVGPFPTLPLPHCVVQQPRSMHTATQVLGH